MAAKGRIDLKELKKRAAEGAIDTVIVCGIDMQGRLYGKRVTASFFLESADGSTNTCACNFGWDMDLILIPGLEFTGWHTGYQDMKAAPDFSTLRVYPWFDKTAIVICDSTYEDGSLVEIAPRTLLRRQHEAAEKMGFTPFMASELEFFLFKDSIDSAREKDYRDVEPFSKYYSDYSVFRGSMDEWLIGAMRNNLNELGLEVESSKAEWGRGQVELAIKYSTALEAGDRHMLLKQGIKEIAALNGVMATFMAKHKTDDSGSGMHIHVSLWDKAAKKNMFWNPKKEHNMSDTMRHFLGGMMRLAPDMQYFYAPLINSYKRYVPESFAPWNVGWGGDNRTVTFRYCGHGNGFRIENRVPGSDACGPLALAACLGSGLYGVKHKLEPVGPFITGDSYKEKSLPPLARTLAEAARNLDASKPAREIFGDGVIDHYVKIAQWEVDRFNEYVTDWERRRYFEMA